MAKLPEREGVGRDEATLAADVAAFVTNEALSGTDYEPNFRAFLEKQTNGEALLARLVVLAAVTFAEAVEWFRERQLLAEAILPLKESMDRGTPVDKQSVYAILDMVKAKWATPPTGGFIDFSDLYTPAPPPSPPAPDITQAGLPTSPRRKPRK